MSVTANSPQLLVACPPARVSLNPSSSGHSLSGHGSAIRRFKSRIFQDFGNDLREFGALKLIKTVSKWSLKLFQSLKISQKVRKSTFFGPKSIKIQRKKRYLKRLLPSRSTLTFPATPFKDHLGFCNCIFQNQDVIYKNIRSENRIIAIVIKQVICPAKHLP